MKTIRWGIIGCGDVTEVKSGPGLQKAAGSELVAVMRRDGAKAEDYARRHGVRRWYADADALIADREVDAVYVATPPGTHEFYAMKVLAAGKACYVEKPMARNASEARRMVEGFERAGVPLFVAYYRRALPRFLKVKELLDAGELGRVKSVSYRFRDGKMVRRVEPVAWRFCAEASGGGLFLDMGSHVLDLLDWWFGPLKVVESRVSNGSGAYAVEDHVVAALVAGGGVAITTEFNFSAEPVDDFVISGDAGEVRLSCFGNEQFRVKDRTGQTRLIDLANPPHVGQPLIQTVVDELAGIGRCASTGESSLRTQEVMDRVLEGYYGGREDGFWTRSWPGNTRASAAEG